MGVSGQQLTTINAAVGERLLRPSFLGVLDSGWRRGVGVTFRLGYKRSPNRKSACNSSAGRHPDSSPSWRSALHLPPTHSSAALKFVWINAPLILCCWQKISCDCL